MSAMTWDPSTCDGSTAWRSSNARSGSERLTKERQMMMIGGVYVVITSKTKGFLGSMKPGTQFRWTRQDPSKMHRIEGKNLPNLCSNKPEIKLSSLFSMHCLVRVPGYSSCQDEPLIWKIVEIFFGKYVDKQFIKGKVQQCYC